MTTTHSGCLRWLTPIAVALLTACGNGGEPTDSDVGVVEGALEPAFECAFVPESSTLPLTLAPSENRWVQVAVRNSGTNAWPAGRLRLVSEDTPVNLWGQTVTDAVASEVAPGAVQTLGFLIHAPGTPGVYSLARDMKDYGGTGDFDQFGSCVSRSITVGGTPPLDAALVFEGFPRTMGPAESRTVSVTLTNTGTTTWPADGTFVLGSRNTPVNLWGTTIRSTPAPTPPGNSVTLSMNVIAPGTPGTYRHVWQMRAISGQNPGYFGATIDVPVAVTTDTVPGYGAQLTSQTIPAVMTAGQFNTASITLRNTGTAAWTAATVNLASLNSPINLWSTTIAPMIPGETVGPGASRTFDVTLRAPAAAGTYTSKWRLYSAQVGYFGETAATAGLVVTLCGNGTVDPGEQCDDGNRANFDGCSSTCVVQPLCGNGFRNDGEGCDDGNTTSGDGCSSTCTVEPRCGDSSLDPGEECDDGNTTNGDGCAAACTIEHRCGDGRLGPGEQCDDGNVTAGDGCSPACQMEPPPAACDGALNFADPSIEAAVRAQLGKPTGPITFEEGQTVTYLNPTDPHSLAGIECLRQLFELAAFSGTVTDLAPLMALPHLAFVELENNRITDIGVLATLPALSYADLAGNDVTDITPLASLSGLQALNLQSNQITTLPSSWTNVTYLNVANNRITDLSPLAGLTSLEYLDVSYNSITDLSPLAGLTSLAYLYVDGFEIDDFAPLAGLTNLNFLSAQGGSSLLPSLSPLVQNTGLVGSFDTVLAGPIDCLAEAANLTALTARGVSLSTQCQTGTESYDSGVVSYSFPSTVVAGTTFSVSVTFVNTGSAWSGRSFQMLGGGGWSFFGVSLNDGEVVSQSAERTFTVTLTAPTGPGTYQADFRMARQLGSGGNQRFGSAASASIVVESSFCGNGTTDWGEACDDGNRQSEDGCSSLCLRETAPTCPAFAGVPAGAYALQLYARSGRCDKQTFECGYGPFSPFGSTLVLTLDEALPDWVQANLDGTYSSFSVTREGSVWHLANSNWSPSGPTAESMDVDVATGNVTNYRYFSMFEWATIWDVYEVVGSGAFSCGE